MKYIQRKTVLLGSVLGVAVGLFAGALVLGERLSPPVSGLWGKERADCMDDILIVEDDRALSQ